MIIEAGPTKCAKKVTVEDRWLSAQEIRKYRGMSTDNVYKWINHSAMPAHRMGRLWKFRKPEVDE